MLRGVLYGNPRLAAARADPPSGTPYRGRFSELGSLTFPFDKPRRQVARTAAVLPVAPFPPLHRVRVPSSVCSSPPEASHRGRGGVDGALSAS